MDIMKLLRKHPTLFHRFTGMDISQFDELMVKLLPVYNKNEKKRLKRKLRQRAIGGGSQFNLSLEERLIMLLFYYRVYMTQEFLGFLFGLDNSNVSRTIRHISPLLAQVFRVPERKVKLSTAEEEMLIYLFVDGTEQPIHRPSKYGKQKRYYSGKKKRHTIKYQVVTTDGKAINAVSKSYEGSMHDKKIYDKTRLEKPPDVKGVSDTGYLGTDLTQPIKKKKGKKLTDPQKKYNKKISKLRIKAEHAVGRMKKYRILSDVFRNPLSTHNLIVKNVAGINNFCCS